MTRNALELKLLFISISLWWNWSHLSSEPFFLQVNLPHPPTTSQSVWVWPFSNVPIWQGWVLLAPFMEFRYPRSQNPFFLITVKSTRKGICDIKTQQTCYIVSFLRFFIFPLKTNISASIVSFSIRIMSGKYHCTHLNKSQEISVNLGKLETNGNARLDNYL